MTSGNILLFAHFMVYGQQKSVGEGRLRVQLRKGMFCTVYEMILKNDGREEVNDADAALIGEGFMSLAGLSPEGSLLSIDERRADTLVKEIKLLVKGWPAGGYALHFIPDVLLRDYHLRLKDGHTQFLVDITDETVYEFSIEENEAATSIKPRFTLILEPKARHQKVQENAVRVYPNPFHDLYIDTHLYGRPTIVTIRDLIGRLVLRTKIEDFCRECKLNVQWLPTGAYLVELFDQQSGRRIKCLKMIKQSTYD